MITIFEKFNSEKIFYIDLRKCKDVKKLIDKISKFGELYFNGSSNPDIFINYEDHSGKAWAWKVIIRYDYNYISGIHAPNWGMPEIGETMISCDDFLLIDEKEDISIVFKEIKKLKKVKDFNL